MWPPPRQSAALAGGAARPSAPAERSGPAVQGFVRFLRTTSARPGQGANHMWPLRKAAQAGGCGIRVEINCESLPCPCAGPGAGGNGETPPTKPPPNSSCTRPSGVQRLVFRRREYPNIRRHFRAALRRGWPKVMVLNRPGADARRDRLLEGVATRPGVDRDEHPAAVWRNHDRRRLGRRQAHPDGYGD